MSKFCTNCGTENLDNAHFCVKCGSQLRKIASEPSSTGHNNTQRPNNNTNPNMFNMPKEKSVGVALLLSFLIPGAGFLYIDDTKQFAIYFAIGILLWILNFFTMVYSTFSIISLLYLIFLIYQLYKIYKETEQYNKNKRLLYQNYYN